MPAKYKVILTEEERVNLTKLISQGKSSARKIKRSHVLLKSAEGLYDKQTLAELCGVSESTVFRVQRNFVNYGVEEALNAKQNALLISLACSEPPQGCSRWTLNLLGEQLVVLSDLERISHETIRQRLKENALKPWQKKMWCLKDFNAQFIARMERILDLYSEEPDENHPIVNFDEAGKQLVDHVNSPTLAKPGSVAKEDYEYERVGVTNIFMFFDRHKGWRKAKVANNKTAVDFAHCMRELVDEGYPDAEVIRVVMDNFSTHCEASLYKAFSPEEALRISKRLEFHFTPKHASWLNMAEIEIGNMNQQCLDRRIPNKEKLTDELRYWQEKRNEHKASILNQLEKAYFQIPLNAGDS
jgi:hypothetical protein